MHPSMGRYKQAENVHRQIYCAYNLCQQIFVVCQTPQLATMGSHDLSYFSMSHQLGDSWNSDRTVVGSVRDGSFNSCCHFHYFVSYKSQHAFFLFVNTTLPNCHPNPLTFIYTKKKVWRLTRSALFVNKRAAQDAIIFHSLPNLFCLCHSQGYRVFTVFFFKNEK